MSYYDFPNLSPEQRAANHTIALIENSVRHQKLREAETTAFAEQQKRDAENEKLLEKHLAERETELLREAETRRKESALQFEQSLRKRFFDGNPFASESDFQNLLPELKKQEMLKNSEKAETVEQVVRQSGNYGAM